MTNERKTIGLVLDFFSPDILEGVQSYAEENGLLLDARWSVRGDWTPTKPGWDGVVYSVTDNADLRTRLGQWKMPQVSLINDGADWFVVPDYSECGRIAVRELSKLGVRSLLNIKVSKRDIDNQFFDGVLKEAELLNIKCESSECSFDKLSEIVKVFEEEIENATFPIGVVSPHAGVMFSLQSKLLEKGIRIPEDVAILVIDKDVQKTHSLAPVPMTTVIIDDWLRGFVAAEMLHRIFEDEPPHQNCVMVPPKGVARRASTGHVEVPDRIVASALSFLRRNYLKPIDVSDIVDHVNASRRTVETRFKETLNRGIHEELSRLRIEDAKRLLVSGDKSVTSIAEECGFSSVHYFSAAFKRVEGMSPKVYQKQKKEL